jgi:hypothetical protein
VGVPVWGAVDVGVMVAEGEGTRISVGTSVEVLVTEGLGMLEGAMAPVGDGSEGVVQAARRRRKSKSND